MHYFIEILSLNLKLCEHFITNCDSTYKVIHDVLVEGPVVKEEQSVHHGPLLRVLGVEPALQLRVAPELVHQVAEDRPAEISTASEQIVKLKVPLTFPLQVK